MVVDTTKDEKLSDHDHIQDAGKNDCWLGREILRRHLVAVLAGSFVLVGGIGGWAYSQQIASAVIAAGVVVVDGNVKKIQHFKGGNVSEIYVREGQEVKAGDVLFELDGTKEYSLRDLYQGQLVQLYVQRARLMAEIKGEDKIVAPEDIQGLPGVDEVLVGSRIF